MKPVPAASPYSAVKGSLLAITGATMWGIMGIFVRNLTASGYTSAEISFLRCLLAGGGLFLLTAITKPTALRITPKGLVIAVLYGLSAYGLGFLTYSVAVARIPVAVATVLMFMSPIWVVVLGVLVFHDPIRKKTVVTVLVCVLGAALVADVFSASAGTMDGLGLLAGIVNGFCVALQIMVPRYFAKTIDRDTILVYGFLGACVGLGFLTDFSTIFISLQSPSAPLVLVNILCLGLLCTMVANTAMVKATVWISTTTCSILSSLEVIVGAVVGLLAFHETMNPLQIIGAVVVVCAALGPTVLTRSKTP